MTSSSYTTENYNLFKQSLFNDISESEQVCTVDFFWKGRSIQRSRVKLLLAGTVFTVYVPLKDRINPCRVKVWDELNEGGNDRLQIPLSMLFNLRIVVRRQVDQFNNFVVIPVNFSQSDNLTGGKNYNLTFISDDPTELRAKINEKTENKGLIRPDPRSFIERNRTYGDTREPPPPPKKPKWMHAL